MVSLAYPELVNELVDLGLMLSQDKAPVYALNITEDEQISASGGKEGQKILQKAIAYAAAAGKNIIPVSRYDSNISRGIVYAIKEHRITDVIVGLHKDADSKVFFGEKVERIIRHIFETIYIYRSVQPLNTLKRMVIAVPGKAEAEIGFTSWITRLLKIAGETSMSVLFYADNNVMNGYLRSSGIFSAESV